MRALEEVFNRLPRSAFRHRFRLAAADKAYLREKGLPTVLEHARDGEPVGNGLNDILGLAALCSAPGHRLAYDGSEAFHARRHQEQRRVGGAINRLEFLDGADVARIGDHHGHLAELVEQRCHG